MRREVGISSAVCCFSAVRPFDLTLCVTLSNTSRGYLFCSFCLSLYPPHAWRKSIVFYKNLSTRLLMRCKHGLLLTTVTRFLLHVTTAIAAVFGAEGLAFAWAFLPVGGMYERTVIRPRLCRHEGTNPVPTSLAGSKSRPQTSST